MQVSFRTLTESIASNDEKLLSVILEYIRNLGANLHVMCEKLLPKGTDFERQMSQAWYDSILLFSKKIKKRTKNTKSQF